MRYLLAGLITIVWLGIANGAPPPPIIGLGLHQIQLRMTVGDLEFVISDETDEDGTTHREWFLDRNGVTTNPLSNFETLDSGTFDTPLAVNHGNLVFDTGKYHLTCGIVPATHNIVTHAPIDITDHPNDGSPTLFMRSKLRTQQITALRCTLSTPANGLLTTLDGRIVIQAAHVVSNGNLGNTPTP
jgi:hypothetical protein